MFSNRILGCILFFLLCALLPLEVWSQKILVKDVEIRLGESVKVGSNNLVLGDVATIYARDMGDFEKLAKLEISRIPSDATELVLPAFYLRARISEALPGRDLVVHAPEQVRFILNKIGIQSDEIAAEVILQGKRSGKIPQEMDVEFHPISGFDSLKTLKLAEAKVEPAGEMAKWRGDMAFKVIAADGTIHWIRAKLRWFGDAWVAKREIRFGSSLDASQFERAKTEILGNETIYSGSSEAILADLGNSRARRTIRARTALTEAMVERRPDAIAGQNLKVVFVSESGLQVSADGQLIQSGTVGTEARARLRTSKKIVSGRLTSANTMEVSL